MNNVIDFQTRKARRNAEECVQSYRAYILGLDKLELLEEMVRFQEERSKLGRLTLDLMLRGRVLFKALEESAETQGLRILTRSYRRHLECELEEYRRANG